MVLDCGTEMAKNLIIGHVRDVQMGRRNYHYLLSGLVSVPYLLCQRKDAKITSKKTVNYQSGINKESSYRWLENIDV